MRILISALAAILLAMSASAEVFSVNESNTVWVNATFDGTFLNVTTSDGLSTSYNVTPANSTNPLTVATPVTVSANVTDIHIQIPAVQLPPVLANFSNFSCADSMSNYSTHLEDVIRTQLVPSQKNYNDLLMLKYNESAECVAAKSILIGQIAEGVSALNASEINCNATVSRVMYMYSVSQDERNTARVLFWVFAAMCVILVMAYAKGKFFPTEIKNFIDERSIDRQGFKLPEKGAKNGK